MYKFVYMQQILCHYCQCAVFFLRILLFNYLISNNYGDIVFEEKFRDLRCRMLFCNSEKKVPRTYLANTVL